MTPGVSCYCLRLGNGSSEVFECAGSSGDTFAVMGLAVPVMPFGG